MGSPVRLGGIRRFLAVGLPVLFVVVSLPRALRETVKWIVDSRRACDDALAARRRRLPQPYVEAIERIRRTIPPREDYILVDANERWHGGVLVRYDLLPRRALHLGRLGPHGRPQGPMPPDAPRYTVISKGGVEPPDVVVTRVIYGNAP